MLKNITLSVLCVLSIGLTTKAQQTTIDHDTLWTTGYVGASSSDYIDLYADTKIRNNTKKFDTLVWTRIVQALPSMNWTSAVCDINLCHGVTENTAEFVMDTFSVKELSFHFYPKMDKGMGQMVVKFAKKSNPSIFTNVVINVQAYGLNINTIRRAEFSLFPNPSKSSVIINSYIGSNGQYTIVNLLGETVLSGNFNNGIPIDISSLDKGIYCINVINSSSVSSSKLIVE